MNNLYLNYTVYSSLEEYTTLHSVVIELITNKSIIRNIFNIFLVLKNEK